MRSCLGLGRETAPSPSPTGAVSGRAIDSGTSNRMIAKHLSAVTLAPVAWASSTLMWLAHRSNASHFSLI
jgi:hypothetical protein